MLTCQLLNMGLSFEDIILLRSYYWGFDSCQSLAVDTYSSRTLNTTQGDVEWAL